MKPGQTIVVEGVPCEVHGRPRHSSDSPLYDQWLVIRQGPKHPELWLIGRRRRHGKFSSDWRFISRRSFGDGHQIYNATS